MIDWAKSLDWDWVISRQRIFATPIPVWYCEECGQMLVAEETWLPVDPRFESPKEKVCRKCGGSKFLGETDVMDTWMDSSITCTVHAGWPSNMKSFDKLFPADLQPNGLDIIRTWDYYLMVKHLALFNKAPYKVVLVNGMVRGVDGRMMHKSYGNYVEATEVLNKYGADALRQWAAGGAVTGYDVPFNWSDLEYGKKFLTKLWNAARFIKINLNKESQTAPLEILDKWIMAKLGKLVSQATDSYENFQFSAIIDSVREFIWHKFCDQYIEAVKYRLYEDVQDPKSKQAAQETLRRVLLTGVALLAPICPHMTETIYKMFKRREDPLSIHQTNWPTQPSPIIGDETEAEGDKIIETISFIRRKKSEMRIPLKNEIPHLLIKCPKKMAETVLRNKKVIERTCRIQKLTVEAVEDSEEIDIEISSAE
jgi:valyl-tRNA synthetase